MKNKIVLKLTFYFAAALLIFAIVIGSSFWILFHQHAETQKRIELEERALKIAHALEQIRDRLNNWEMRRENINHDTSPPKPDEMHPGPFASYGALLYFLSTSAADDVWVINRDKSVAVRDLPGDKERNIRYQDWPEDVDKVIAEAFQGKTIFSQGFSPLLKMPTLSVGVPIRARSGEVTGVVLIHSPLSGLDETTAKGMKILFISCGIALLLAVFLSIFFSWKFTKPLNMMKHTAEKMTDGDYEARSGVAQNDEIGELAATMDVLAERLEVARRKSAELDQLRKDFIANISHELRTPVTVIRGSLEAICDKVVTKPEQVEEYQRQMLAESIFLQRLINDLLELSRLDNHNFQIEKILLNFSDVLYDAVRSSRQMGRAKGVKVEFSGDDYPYMLDGDYGRLKQMLVIFMDNALKFSVPGAVVTVERHGGCIKISDTGCGIPSKALEHIFERFYKSRIEKNKSGSGLGLAIAKEIAERHGISVKLESVDGHGTTVIVDLPPQKEA